LIGLKAGTRKGKIEEPLPSGDWLDVSFRVGTAWVAAEVKAKTSGDADIARGLFQCVKYRAVIEAVQAVRQEPQDARAVLVLEGSFPPSLVQYKNTLGIEVFDQVSPK
jgi:hypothetical protein